MRIFGLLLVLFTLLLGFTSCQKQLSFDTGGVSVGSLKADLTGDCLPVTVNGVFKVDSVLTNDNFVDVQVNVSIEGTFEIRSDTVNGYSFRKVGSVGKGLNTIRLYASGKPVTTGTNTFTIRYNSSTSICKFDVTVVGAVAGGSAVYTLGGAPNACALFTANGFYTAQVPLGAANNVTFNVNVTTIGSYTINTSTADGINFVASGTFTNTGIQTMTLLGTGTPTTAGVFSFTATGAGSSCTFNITVLPGGTSAVYTLGGSPNACTNVILTGVYMAGISTSAANTAKVDVNVSSLGTYSLTTITLNGVKFTATGVFTIAGPQTVTLVANIATPTASGTFSYLINGAGTSCSFPVTYAVPAPPAVFTLSGAPGSCAPASVNGTYTAGTALNATNNVVIEVNVTTAGSYILSTNTVNGMTFSASGVFTLTGLQNVTLTPTVGSNPLAAGTSTLTPQYGTSSCTFDVIVGGVSDRIYKFNIGPTVYQGACSGFLIDLGGGSQEMSITGGGSGNFTLNLTNAVGPVTAGFYSGTSTAGKYASIQFLGAITFLGDPATGFTNLSATITNINTTTRVVEGIFSGTVIDLAFNTLTITGGTFKADY